MAMEALFRAFVPAGHPELRVNVRIGGEHLASWTLTNWDVEKFTLMIPAACLYLRECEIQFEIANPVSPLPKAHQFPLSAVAAQCGS